MTWWTADRMPPTGYFLCDDIQTFQFLVKMTSFQAYIFGCLRDIALVFCQFLIQIFPFKAPFGLFEITGLIREQEIVRQEPG